MSNASSSESRITRRSFLKAAGALAISGSLATMMGCSSQAADKPSSAGETDQGFDETPTDVQEQELSPEAELEQRIDGMISLMPLEQKVAQLFIITPEELTGVSQVVQAGNQTKESLASNPPAGLIYFKQNLQNADQVAALLGNTQSFAEEVCPSPLFLCVDEEGGTVTRIGGEPGFSARDVGNMASVGATGEVELARSAAEEIGTYLKLLGFNVDFAPVADIADSPSSEMVKRSFGSDASLVSQMVAAQVQGFKQAGIMCCVKHFPGIGSSESDSHTDGITTDSSLEDLLAHELLPFQAAIDAGVDFVMVGHLSVPQVTGGSIPASLSGDLVDEVLRKRMGFDGVVVTDSLGMGAVFNYYSPSESALMAIQAGCDIPLMTPDFSAAREGVISAVRSGDLPESRINESLRRILRLKMKNLADQES